MGFLWPGLLLLLGIIPISVGLYAWMLRRKRYAVHFSSLSLVRAAVPRHSFLRRHLPFGLFLLAVGSLVFALARPTASVQVPADQATIMLTLDVSRSMRQSDITPSRMQAAKTAALSFIRAQSPHTQIGIVAFYGYAELIQAPTTNQELLEAAVSGLTLGRRTAIGSGILEALDAIYQLYDLDSPAAAGVSPIPVTGEGYLPSIIVLLTDGVSNNGPLPLEAAQQAADSRVRVYTIGFGTARGDSFFGGGPGGMDPFGGMDDQFRGWRHGLDEDTLREVADMTGGAYYSANSSDELLDVFASLPTNLMTKTEQTEVSYLFTAAGAALALLAIVLSLLWSPR